MKSSKSERNGVKNIVKSLVGTYINEFGNGTSKNNNFDSVSWIATIFCFLLKVRQSRNDFFKPTFPPKKRTNKFYFTAMKPQVDLFSFVFWRILKTPKRHFEIN